MVWLQGPTWRPLILPIVLATVFFGFVLGGTLMSTYVSIWPAYDATYLVGVLFLFLCIGPWLWFSWYLSLRVHSLREGRYFHIGFAVFYLVLAALSLALLVFGPSNPASRYFNTFNIWLGMLFVFLLIPSAALEIYKAAKWSDHWSTKNQMHCHAPSDLRPHTPNRKTNLILLLIFCSAFLFALFVVTIFPPHWNQLIGQIQATPSDNAVFNLDIGVGSTKWYIKLFPDQLVFWSWCLIIVLATFSLLNFPAGRRLLHTPLRFDFYFTRLRLSVGELLLSLSFFGLLSWWIWYWSTGYTAMSSAEIQNGNEYGRIAQLPPLENAARTLGHCTSLFISFLVLPLARNSIWQRLFGVSYERGIRFHRWLGAGTVIITALHMFVWWARWIQAGQFSDQWSFHPNVIGPPCEFQGTCHTGNFLLPFLFFAMLLLVFIAILATDYVRRRWYELFYYSHHLTWVYLLIGLCHAWSMWNYLLFGGLLYLIDKCVRHARSLEPVKLVSLTRTRDGLHSRLVLSRTSSPLHFSAGQFAWINIPSIDPYEWHPFSLVSHPDGYVQFVIKAISYPIPTWTSKLLSFAATPRQMTQVNSASDLQQQHHHSGGSESYLPLLHSADPALEVYVDGPYGQLQRDPAEYEVVLLVAGGIGVTPVFSLFVDLARNTPAKLETCILYWTAQSSSLFDIFASELESVIFNRTNFQIVLSATRENTENIVSEDAIATGRVISKSKGRIDFESEFRRLNKPHKGRVLVIACGPQALLSSCQDLCAQLDFDIHTETFAF